MEVYKVGSQITINKMKIDGIVKSIILGDNDSVQYNIGYFSGDTYCVYTFASFEVSGTKEDLRKVGFK